MPTVTRVLPWRRHTSVPSVEAAPVVIQLKERDPRWRQVRARIEARGLPPSDRLATPATVGALTATATEPAAGPATPGSAAGPYTHPPRPRKGRSQARRRK